MLPLLLFLLLFAGACIGLEQAGYLLFGRPVMLGLVAFSVWLWWMSLAGWSGLSRTRSLLSLSVRLLLFGGLVMVLAEPRTVRTRDVVSVVYAVDVSDSIGERSVDQALRFVTKQVTDKPENDEAGMVVFGGTAAVELPPGTSFPFEGVVASHVKRDATNLEQALSLAAAMLPEENRGRIVLISDGTANTGSLTQLLDELKSRKIAVDVLPIEYQYDREVWVERLEVPQYVKIGQDYEVAALVTSLQDGRGRLVLRENGRLISEGEVEFKAGKNRYTLPIRVPQAGYYEYEATIDPAPGEDNLRQNNSVTNFLFVEGEGRVLLVTDQAGDDRDWKELAETLKATDRSIDIQSSIDFPHDALALMPYDCIVWANVPSEGFDEAQMQAVHDAVRDLGIGFIMIGGPNSFGPGGYHRTMVEKALPVSMDVSQKKVLPKGALAIILHTCEFPDGNTWGKRIARQAIKVLTAQDEVGVLAYGSTEYWVFKLTPASQYEELATKINGADLGDMPSFAATMEMGLTELMKSDAATRHMIIISDGDPVPAPPAVIKGFIDNQISISTVAIFPHGGQDISKMRAVAMATGGRYYFPSDPAQLPSIFIKEAKTLKRVMIQERKVVPEKGIESPVLKGIDTMMPLDGYVLTSLKPEAEPILQTPKGTEPDQEENDPILARWRYGLGSAAAFTSDLSTRWGKNWLPWEKLKPLVRQLVTDISRVRTPGHVRLWSYVAGNDAVLVAEDFHPEESFLDITARVIGPDNLSQNVPLRQISPRRYQARVPLWGQGRYQMIAQATGGGRGETLTSGFIVPYSPEYLRFRSNPIVLDEIREKTGGELLNAGSPAETVFGRREPKQSSSPVQDWFLIALACLVPLDVAVRRIQIDVRALMSLFQRKVPDGPATATTGALLQRKQEVEARLDVHRQTVPPPSRITGAPVPPPSPPPGMPAPSAKPSTPPAATDTTTSRLLAMKRQRQQDADEQSGSK